MLASKSRTVLLYLALSLFVALVYGQVNENEALELKVDEENLVAREALPPALEDSEVPDILERSLEERSGDWFHLRAYGANSRYQKSKGSWMAFNEDGDAIVTSNYGEAARFYQVGENLVVGKRWVWFHFSNGYTVWKLGKHRPHHRGWRFWRDKWGWLHIGGYHGWHGWGVGYGEGISCVSDDGSVFVEGDRHAPFKCRPVDWCNGQGPHQNPPPHPPNRPHPPKPHPTKSYPHPTYHTTKTTKSYPTYQTTKTTKSYPTYQTTKTTKTTKTYSTTSPTTTKTTMTMTTTSGPTTTTKTTYTTSTSSTGTTKTTSTTSTATTTTTSSTATSTTSSSTSSTTTSSTTRSTTSSTATSTTSSTTSSSSSSMTTTTTATTTTSTTATGTFTTTSSTPNPSDEPDPDMYPPRRRYISEFEEGDDQIYEVED